MHTCGNEDTFFRFAFLAIGVLILRRDGDILATVACQRPAKCTPVEEILGEAVSLNAGEILHQVRVGVGEAVGEVNLVVRLCELVREGQRVVAPAEAIALPLEAVLLVVYVRADSVPGELVRAVSRVLRERKHAHAIVVERVRLGEVQNIEFYFHILPRVADSEEEPLCMAIGINVILQH